MARDILFDDKARRRVLSGVRQLSEAVITTLGPRGRNVVIEKSWGAPHITKDGVTVAKAIDLSDPFENLGAQMIKQAASQTNDLAGDGTTTATVLASAIFEKGVRFVAAGHNPVALKRGIDKAVRAVTDALRELATSVDSNDKIRQVAALSANSDDEIGGMIAEAMARVGNQGVITIEEAKTLASELEVVEGMAFDRGYLSPHFITDHDRQTVEFDEPLIFLTDKKIGNLRELLPLLEKVHEARRPLVVIAEDVEGDALAALAVNSARGNLKVVAVKAPGFGDRRKAMLDDIAILTGATVVTDTLGMTLEGVQLQDLGTARRVVVTKDETRVIDGAGDSAAVRGRVEQIKAQKEATDSSYDKEKFDERIAKLAGGVAVIHVGAATEVEMKEKKDRLDDALAATRAAVEEGIVPGGGVALVRALSALDNLDTDEEEAFGVAIIREAIVEPLRAIVKNDAKEASVVLAAVQAGEGNYGYNAATGEYGDLIAQGVIDPVRVTRLALEHAASAATMLLTTEVAITDIPEKSDPAADAAAMGGMGGMGGMF